MPARRTKKAAPRKVAGARRAKVSATRAPRKKASGSASPARTTRKAAAPKRRPATKPTRAVAAKPAAPRRTVKPATRAAAVRDLERGCDAVLAAIRGLSADAAERPIAPGKRTPRQILLHMAYWDEWMLGVLPGAIMRGRRPDTLTTERVDAANAQAIASGAHLPWEDVRTLWATQRALLLGLLAAVPATPAVRWTSEHALGALLDGYADHDLHHAAQIRAARGAKRSAFAPAFAPQVAGASPRELMLFELERGRVPVLAAVQGLSVAAAMRPVAPGKWSVHEIVLHLVVRDQVRLDELDRIWAGAPPSWAGNTREQWADVNERGIAPLRARSWDEAVRLLVATRERLIAALIERPAEPAVTWTAAHPFGAMLADLPPHDRHHAEQIKLVRISS